MNLPNHKPRDKTDLPLTAPGIWASKDPGETPPKDQRPNGLGGKGFSPRGSYWSVDKSGSRHPSAAFTQMGLKF